MNQTQSDHDLIQPPWTGRSGLRPQHTLQDNSAVRVVVHCGSLQWIPGTNPRIKIRFRRPGFDIRRGAIFKLQRLKLLRSGLFLSPIYALVFRFTRESTILHRRRTGGTINLVTARQSLGAPAETAEPRTWWANNKTGIGNNLLHQSNSEIWLQTQLLLIGRERQRR